MANMCHSHDCGGHKQSSVNQTLDEMEFERGIWSAALNGEMSSVETFLRKGVDVNSEDSYGFTALHYGSRNGHEDVCRLLLEHRANSNCQTRAGKVTPVHRAANRGHLELLKLLIKYRGDPAILDADGKNALHKAAETGHSNVIKFLVENYPNLINCRDNQRRAPKDYLSENHQSCLPLFEKTDYYS